MGIIRLLLIIGALWLAWRLVRRALLPPPGKDAQGQSSPARPTRMLRCEQCGIHVPESESYSARGHHFCSVEHQQQWLEHNDK